MEICLCFQHNAKDAPVLLWLQGGPGGSSLFGLFNENGPFQVKENLKVTKRQTSWVTIMCHNDELSWLFANRLSAAI